MTTARTFFLDEAERGLDRIRSIRSKALAEGRYLKDSETDEIASLQTQARDYLTKVKQIDTPKSDEELAGEKAMRAQVLSLGVIPGPGERGLWSAIKGAGYDPANGRAKVVVPFSSIKAATFDGDVADSGIMPVRGVPLGADRRRLYPVLPTVAVDDGVTQVTSVRQMSRNLASTSDMIRDIDQADDKPETDTVRELVPLALNQVGSVETGVPNVFASQDGFRGMIETDLRLAYEAALDALATDAILAAGVPGSAAGADLMAGVRSAITLVQSAGYNPNVVAASPEDAEELDLLQTGGPEAFYVFASAARSIDSAPLFGLDLRIVPGLSEPIVMDAQALGRLFVSPVRFATFEENAGKTNSFTARLESNAGMSVERPDAAAVIGGAS